MAGTIPSLERLGGAKTHGGGEKKSLLVPKLLTEVGLMVIAASCAPIPDQTPIAPTEYSPTQLDVFLKGELAPQLAASTKTFIEAVSPQLPSDISIDQIQSFNFQSGISQENGQLTIKPLSINYEASIKNQDNSIGNYKVEHKPFNLLMKDGSQKLLVYSTYTDENGKIATIVQEVMLLQDGSDLVIAIKSDKTESRIGLYGFSDVLDSQGKIVKGGPVFGFDYIKGIKNLQATFLNTPGLIGVADVETTLEGIVNKSAGISTPEAQKNLDLYQGQSVNVSFNPSGSPTEAPAPSVPMIEVGGIQVPDPKASNPELFDVTNPDSPIFQFANAFGVKPEDVGDLTPQLLTGVDGKQFIVLTTNDLTATANFDETGTPLLIAEQGENGEWGWRQITTKDKSRLFKTTAIGVGIDEYDNYKSPKYRERVLESASIVFPTGAFMPSYRESHGESAANSFEALVTEDANQKDILYLHPGFWNNNLPEALQGSPSNEATINNMNQQVANNLKIVKQIIDQGGEPVYINYINEPWWADPPNNPVNVGWIESPYYKATSSQLLVDSYMMYHDQADQLDLTIGKDFRMVVSIDGIFFPNKKLDFAIEQIIEAKKEIARRLSITPDQVQLDIASEWRFDKDVTGPKMSADGRYKIPTADELNKALTQIKETAAKNGVTIPIHITEFELVGMSSEEREQLMEQFTRIAENNQANSINYHGIFSSSTNPNQDQNTWFDDQGNPTEFYYSFLRSQWQ